MQLRRSVNCTPIWNIVTSETLKIIITIIMIIYFNNILNQLDNNFSLIKVVMAKRHSKIV